MSTIHAGSHPAALHFGARGDDRAERRRQMALAVEQLRERADAMCSTSSTVHPVLAATYRRRAGEFALAAWVGAIAAGLEDSGDGADGWLPRPPRSHAA